VDLLEGRSSSGARARAGGWGGGRRQAGAQQPQLVLPGGAALPAARPQQQGLQPLRKPKGSRAVVSSAPGRFEVDIPPQGLTGSTLATGSFALVWNGFVVAWTASALASGGVLFALFSIPFWLAGGQLASQALLPALLRENFKIGRSRFRISRELAVLKDGAASFLGGGGLTPVEGDVADLRGARVGGWVGRVGAASAACCGRPMVRRRARVCVCMGPAHTQGPCLPALAGPALQGLPGACRAGGYRCAARRSSPRWW
jgi:hypothetical protein